MPSPSVSVFVGSVRSKDALVKSKSFPASQPSLNPSPSVSLLLQSVPNASSFGNVPSAYVHPGLYVPSNNPSLSLSMSRTSGIPSPSVSTGGSVNDVPNHSTSSVIPSTSVSVDNGFAPYCNSNASAIPSPSLSAFVGSVRSKVAGVADPSVKFKSFPASQPSVNPSPSVSLSLQSVPNASSFGNVPSAYVHPGLYVPSNNPSLSLSMSRASGISSLSTSLGVPVSIAPLAFPSANPLEFPPTTSVESFIPSKSLSVINGFNPFANSNASSNPSPSLSKFVGSVRSKVAGVADPSVKFKSFPASQPSVNPSPSVSLSLQSVPNASSFGNVPSAYVHPGLYVPSNNPSLSLSRSIASTIPSPSVSVGFPDS